MPRTFDAVGRIWGAFAGAAILLVVGCQWRAEQPANNQASPANVAEPPRQFTLPRPEAPLDRERLLLAVVRAQSAHAMGEDDRQAQGALDGARFELRIRFGCGAVPAERGRATLAVSRRRGAETIQVSAAPDVTLDNEVAAVLAGEGVEAVEGFWVPRPWLLRPACPPAPAAVPDTGDEAETGGEAPGGDEAGAGNASAAKAGAGRDASAAAAAPAEPAAPVPPRVGIAQFFTADDSRLQRRGERAYSAVVRTSEAEPAGTQGYDLVLSGRLRANAEGRAIRCTTPDPAQAPVCLIGAEFDRVAIEDVERARVLGEWERG